MICFLTSQINIPDTGDLNPANRFAEELRRCFPSPCRALYICSNPDDWDTMDFYASGTREIFESASFRFADFRLLDGRNAQRAAELIQGANCLILAGGHVPTQNRFFREIGLRELLKDYDGLVIGISAGSMNGADIVYAQPEEAGEAVDPGYQRFLTGLGLTKTMLLPHYQRVKDDVLDGLRLFEDITLADSAGRCFYAIPDGSYLFIEGDREELRGEAYRIHDGVLTQIASENDTVRLA